MNFSKIIGQGHAVAALQSALSHRRLSGAYLFAGPAGVGKRATAAALFCAVNCESGGCDHCEICTRVSSGQHPDLIVIEPDGRFIKIDQVRALAENAAFPPHEARARIIVIDGAETLNLSAANALLKSVEEPRADTHFVLCTSAMHRVILTLRSRCQLLRFRPLSDQETATVVSAQLAAAGRPELTQQTKANALRLAEGSPGRALELLNGDFLAEALTLAEQLWQMLITPSASATFSFSEPLGRERPRVAETLKLLRLWLRDVMLQREMGGDRTATVEALRGVEALSNTKLRATLWELQQAQTALDANVNPRLVVENFVFASTSV